MFKNAEKSTHQESYQSKYKVISLFSGAGGMDIGLEQTGYFTTLACFEKVPAFCNTLRINRDAGRLGAEDLLIFEKDIIDIDPHEIMKACNLKPGELELLVGGPPCQTFSTVGRRSTIQDPRGMLLWQFLRFVEVFRPKLFIMENVRGLLSAAIKHRPLKSRPDKGGPPLEPEEQPGSVINLWLEDLARIANGTYHVDCFEVNAVNYGAYQLRERALFFGNRLGHIIDFPQPTHSNIQDRSLVQKTLFDIEIENTELGKSNGFLPFATLGNALDTATEDNGEIMDFSPRKKRYLDMVPEGANWRALPVKIQQESMGKAWYAKGGRSGWWRRLSRDLPCPTIVTMPNHSGTAMCHPTETRALTVKECATVQHFPTDWQFYGTIGEKYTQIGNALPVRLAQVAGEVAAKHLDHSNDPSFICSPQPPQYRRVYINSQVRTRQWYKDGIVYSWTDGEENEHAQYSAKQRTKSSVGSSRGHHEDLTPGMLALATTYEGERPLCGTSSDTVCV